jgi:hypothetical protein
MSWGKPKQSDGRISEALLGLAAIVGANRFRIIHCRIQKIKRVRFSLTVKFQKHLKPKGL